MSLGPSPHEGWTCNGDPAHSMDAAALAGVKQMGFMVVCRVLQGSEKGQGPCRMPSKRQAREQRDAPFKTLVSKEGCWVLGGRGSPLQPWRPDTLIIDPASGMGPGWGIPAGWFMPLSLGIPPRQDVCTLLGEDTHFPIHFYCIPYASPLSSSR